MEEYNDSPISKYDSLNVDVKHCVTELLDAFTQKEVKNLKGKDKENMVDYVLDFYSALADIPQLILADLWKGSEKLEYTINSLPDGLHLFINAAGNLVCGKISRRVITKEALFRVLKMVSPTPLPATLLEVYTDSGNLED
ncbi:hypothetical protein FACS1894176_06830 [Bacteroidia bacterium]|nr:hypothetical protein FACS1894176_06830 [Bacteroidia bacterium]